MNAPESVFLKITSAVAIDGQIARKDSIVEVTESEARNLLGRGKAVLATEADGAPAAESVSPAGTTDGDKPARGKAKAAE